MKIGEFLKQKMELSGIKQAELARLSGVPASTISSIVNRNGDVAIETMISLCNALGCDVEEYIDAMKKEPSRRMPSAFTKKYYALDSHGKELVNTVLEIEYNRIVNAETFPPMIEISCSAIPASAGTGEWLDEEQLETISVPDTPEARKADVVIPVSGDSMEPTFSDGDRVLVRQQPAVEVGEIGVFIVEGNGYIKEFQPGRLVSHNERYKDIVFGEFDDVRCVGKVLGKV